MLKRLYAQFLLWALEPVRAEIARDSPSSETQAANGGWILRSDGGIVIDGGFVSQASIKNCRVVV